MKYETSSSAIGTGKTGQHWQNSGRRFYNISSHAIRLAGGAYRFLVLAQIERSLQDDSATVTRPVLVDLHNAHANLTALEATLGALQAEGCDAIFHTGDVIAIGPYPAESLDLLFDEPKTECVMGNHEAYFVNGLPEPRPAWMSEGEIVHQRWVHRRLGSERRSRVASWPYLINREFEGVRVAFLHYGLTESGEDFVPVERPVSVEALEGIFKAQEADLIFYGHDHRASDLQGRARYVNPGSLGCHKEAVARYCVVDFCRGAYEVAHRSVGYDDAPLYRAFEERRVPEREFIYTAFFGGRFGVGELAQG